MCPVSNLKPFVTGACHRCKCPKSLFLEIKPWQLKSTKRQKQRVFDAASGKTLNTEPVLSSDGEGAKVTPGPAAKSYERARTAAGAHLIFNAFWLVSSFCCYQMYMRDSLHQVNAYTESAHYQNRTESGIDVLLTSLLSLMQVDHGIIIHVLRGILRLYFG